MSQYAPKPYKAVGGKDKVELDFANYAKDLKNGTGVDTSKLGSKSDLASLKHEIDKLDVEKL